MSLVVSWFLFHEVNKGVSSKEIYKFVCVCVCRDKERQFESDGVPKKFYNHFISMTDLKSIRLNSLVNPRGRDRHIHVQRFKEMRYEGIWINRRDSSEAEWGEERLKEYMETFPRRELRELRSDGFFFLSESGNKENKI